MLDDDRHISVVGGLVFALHGLLLACAFAVGIDGDHLLAAHLACRETPNLWCYLSNMGGRPFHGLAVVVGLACWGFACALVTGLLLVAVAVARRWPSLAGGFVTDGREEATRRHR